MRRSALPLLLVLSQMACSGSWRVDPAGPVATVTERRPGLVRVTTTDSSRLEVTNPTVRSDSLVGNAYSAITQTPQPIALPLGSIALLEYRTSGGGSAAPLIGLGLLAAVVIGIAGGAGSSGSY